MPCDDSLLQQGVWQEMHAGADDASIERQLQSLCPEAGDLDPSIVLHVTTPCDGSL